MSKGEPANPLDNGADPRPSQSGGLPVPECMVSLSATPSITAGVIVVDDVAPEDTVILG